ncbi:hypothetical protein [Streptomyces canus]|uniref:hypothetical protein n=1 Tax=Streptomyces canus TaxID=58343 RepID=UPI002E269941
MATKPKRHQLLLSIILIGVASFHLGSWEAHWYLAVMRVGLLFIAFLILYVEGRRRHLQSLERPGSDEGRRVGVPPAHASELQRLAGNKRYTPTMTQVFALAVIEPSDLRQRVVETYTPTHRTLDQRVTVDVQVPARFAGRRTDADAGTSGPDAERIAFPVIIPPKGTLLDNFDIYDEAGRHVAALSYRESLLLTACTLRTLLLSAYKAKRLPAEAVTAEYQALAAIIQRNNPGADRDESRPWLSQEAGSAIRMLSELESAVTDKASLRMAIRLAKELSGHYAVVAPISLPPGGRFSLRYERSLIPELELTPERHMRFRQSGKWTRGIQSAWIDVKGKLRVLLGTRPVSVTVSLDNAWTCQSYHVRVQAPPGLYLRRQELDASKEYLKKRTKGAPTPPYYRFRGRFGQSFAHFYGRFFSVPDVPATRAKLKLYFYETPPGSNFRAVVASATCLTLVWAVAFSMSRVPDPGTDAPAFLLAFPGVAASWLGFESPTNRLFEGTLAARLSLTLTTITSIAASGLFMMNRAGVRLPFHVTALQDSSFLGVYRVPWMILVAASLVNTAYIGYRYLVDSATFKYLAERVNQAQNL